MVKRRKINSKAHERTAEVLRSFGLPADAAGSLPYMTLTGNHYFEAEDHCGVLQMDENCIRILSAGGVIRLNGKRMRAICMDNERISVDGLINSITFE